MANRVFMESTKVPTASSVGEIQALLVKCGATQINSEYTDGRISSLRWTFKINGRLQLFDMPIRVDAIQHLLRSRDVDKCERIAWRQLLRWVQSQVALIQTGMVRTADPFSGYAYFPEHGHRLSDLLQEFPLYIEAGKEHKRIA